MITVFSKQVAVVFLASFVLLCGLGVQTGMAEVSSNQKTVHLSCGDAPQALCVALSKAVFQTENVKQATASSEADLAVKLVVTQLKTNHLAARLDWTEAGSEQISGPEIELSVMDAELREIELDQFADTLLAVSKPPLSKN